MKDLVLYLLKNLADHPDQAEVQESEQNGSVVLRLVCAEEDKGKVIGKQGKVIKAIRALAAAAATKSGKRVSVEID
jgi:hypothetical protein